MLGALDELRGRGARTGPSARGSRTRTCTPRSSAACSRSSARLGGKLRAGRSRNDQVATDLRLYLRDHARLVVDRLAELEQALVDQADAAPRHPRARHDAPAARPAGAVRATSCSRTCRPSPATSTGCATGTCGPSVSPLGSGALAGSSLPLDPIATAAELGFGVGRAELDGRRVRPRLRRGVPLRGRAARRAPVAAGRGGRALELHGVRLGDARRRLLDRLARSCRRRRTPTSPSWPAARPAGSSATSPARWRCSRACRSPTTATCRRRRSPASTPSRRCCSCCPRWPA